MQDLLRAGFHYGLMCAKESIVFVLDALYSCAPIIERFGKTNAWQFIIAIKPQGNKYLFNQFEQLDNQGKVQWQTTQDKQGEHCFGYSNNLSVNQSNAGVLVNMLYYRWTNSKGETKIFTWITSIKLNQDNLVKVMNMGRSRWKIENETFNTLKIMYCIWSTQNASIIR